MSTTTLAASTTTTLSCTLKITLNVTLKVTLKVTLNGVIHSEANLRPALPDNLPLLQTQNGITCINGLFRHGWLLAPALVERAVAELANAQHASSNESIELATQL